MDQSVEQTRLEKKARKRRARGGGDDDDSDDSKHRSSAQPVFEQLEKSSERVLRAELAAAKGIAAAKTAFAASARGLC